MLEALGVKTGPRRRRDHSARFIHSTGAETEDHSDSDQKALGMMGLVRRDTALLLRDLRLGASSWLNSFLELSGHKSQPKSVPIAEPVRRSVSEAALAQPEDPVGTDPLKSLTIHDLSLRGNSETSDTPELSLSDETLGPSTPSDVNFLLRPEDTPEKVESQEEMSTKDRSSSSIGATFPEDFLPRRSSQGPTQIPLYSSPIAKNPFMSPLLAPDSMLQTLPPVHIVVSTGWARCTCEKGGWGGGLQVHLRKSSRKWGRSVAWPKGRAVPLGGTAWNGRTESSWEDRWESALPFPFAILLSAMGPWASHRT